MEIGTSQNVFLDWDKAGIGERFLALLLDFAILSGIVILMAFAQLFDTAPAVAGIITGVLFYFYHMIMEIFNHGQSFGKNIMKIRVISRSGEKAGVFQYVIRNLLRPIDYLFGLGLVVMIASQLDQRLGDLAAGTVVIKLDKLVTYDETVHEVLEDDYKPVFEKHQLTKLNAQNIELIKSTLDDCLKQKRYEAIALLHHKVSGIMEVEMENLNRIQYLQAVVKDFNYYEL